MTNYLETSYEIPDTKHIVLFGGAFNPPHIGHLIVIQQAFELISDIDELWLMPCYHHSFSKSLASPEHRLAMTNLLINELPEELREKVKICSVEIDHKLSGETIEAVKKIQTDSKYSSPNTKYSFLMGSDNIKSFKRWSRWQDLIRMIHFYIYPRSGHLPHRLHENMSMLESDTQIITNFSSSIIRNRLEKNLSLKNFIPQSILTYIKDNHLY